MISAIISRLVILLFGTLYPAYASYKAVRTKNVKEYVKWMMYWIVFALFTCAETFTDLFLSFWFPFYYEIKIVLVIWLLSPATKGSSILYRNFVHPALTSREQEIDEYISKAKEQGYHTMLHLGSKGVTYATNVIMQTALKSGGGIVNHLRRSYSLSDLSDESEHQPDLNRNNKLQIGNVDTADCSRDSRMRSSHKPGGSHIDLYFPEVDVNVRTSHLAQDSSSSLSQIKSNEEISSGYSRINAPIGEEQIATEGNQLMRTASVGATRSRTKSSRTATQSKKTLANEEEEEDNATLEYGCHLDPIPFPFSRPFPEVTYVYPERLFPKVYLPPDAFLKLIHANSIRRGYETQKVDIAGNHREIEEPDEIRFVFKDCTGLNEKELLNIENITKHNNNQLKISNNKTQSKSDSFSGSNTNDIGNRSSLSNLVGSIELLSDKLTTDKIINKASENETGSDGEQTLELYEDASDLVSTTLANSLESIATSHGDCEDLSPNTGMVFASHTINNRKGKYNKMRAPFPPDMQVIEKEEMKITYIIDSIPKNSEKNYIYPPSQCKESILSDLSINENNEMIDVKPNESIAMATDLNVSGKQENDSISCKRNNFSKLFTKMPLANIFNSFSGKDSKDDKMN